MASNDRVEIAVVGGGAVGGVMAAAVQTAGHAVTLCVRTAIPELTIESSGVRRVVPVRIATDPTPEQPVPWVILATKAQDTEGAAPWLKSLTGPGTIVVVLQNGIGHEERVRPFVDGASVLPGLVYVAAERAGPGRIVHHSGRQIVVPEGETGDAFARLLAGSGLDVVRESDFTTASWRKLLSNVAANPITALTLRRIGIMREPAINDLARKLLAEAAATGRAAGARLTDKDIDDVMALYASFGDSGSSMLYDRLAGRPLEHQHLTGAVVRAADRHGVPAPLNSAILALLDALDKGQQAKP